MQKFAVRVLVDDVWQYRSRNSSWLLEGWEKAQLWDNERTAQKEAQRLQKGKPQLIEARQPNPHPNIVATYSPKPSACVVSLEIQEPA